MLSEKRAQKFFTDDCHYPDLGSASNWLKQISHAARPIRRDIQKTAARETRKPVVASRNVGCFFSGSDPFRKKRKREKEKANDLLIVSQQTFLRFAV